MYEHLNFERTREMLARQTTRLSQMLFCNSDQSRPVRVFDGTYCYIQKSRNYEFQKETFSDQKKRNFIRVMVCVSTDGTINSVMGPFKATTNDAQVLDAIVRDSNPLDKLMPGNVILLDRGFRDCVPLLRARGFNVQMPALLQRSENKQQLTTIKANRSRLVTANCYCVETRNGHIKTIFKIFQKEWNPRDIDCEFVRL